MCYVKSVVLHTEVLIYRIYKEYIFYWLFLFLLETVSNSKRKISLLARPEENGSESTGLTQEIDIMDIGSSTPKRKKSKSPLKGVLKIRYNFFLYTLSLYLTYGSSNCNVLFVGPYLTMKLQWMSI